MSDSKNIKDIIETEENEFVIEFTKPYSFEGTVYNKIDLSGLNEITGADMIKVNKIMQKSGTIDVIPEMSMEYACRISSLACKLPYEFFLGLSPKDVIKVKNRVTSFFYGAE